MNHGDQRNDHPEKEEKFFHCFFAAGRIGFIKAITGTKKLNTIFTTTYHQKTSISDSKNEKIFKKFLINGEPYGPCDLIGCERPDGSTQIVMVGPLVAQQLSGMENIPEETIRAAESWLSQWPDEKTRPKIHRK